MKLGYSAPRCLGVVVVVSLVAGLACSLKPKGPSREMVLPLLQQEAQSLKVDGEKANPELGVKATWTIKSVEAREQASNESQPWAGTIQFNITSEMREVDGTPLVQKFDKRFEYVWSTAMNRWIIQYTPPAPASR
jgi:hypothetical protein